MIIPLSCLPDAIHAEDPTLAEVIDQYFVESKKALGKTKAQSLKAIKDLRHRTPAVLRDR